eukprot:Opistho-2@60034
MVKHNPCLFSVLRSCGYAPALLNVGGGYEIRASDVRNNTRVLLDDVSLADKIWQRMKHEIPPTWEEHDVKGLNERLRFLRYDPGEKFEPHFDGAYVRENGERSFITVQLYLNEGYQGGSTSFLDSTEDGAQRFDYIPKTGSVLVFQHRLLHEGALLREGRKYTIRTDIMYAPSVL